MPRAPALVADDAHAKTQTPLPSATANTSPQR
jgi:hypothetical protein